VRSAASRREAIKVRDTISVEFVKLRWDFDSSVFDVRGSRGRQRGKQEGRGIGEEQLERLNDEFIRELIPFQDGLDELDHMLAAKAPQMSDIII
jgi:hypothetical protein